MRLYIKGFLLKSVVFIWGLWVSTVLGDSASDYASFLQALEDLNSDKFTDIVIDELTNYLSRYEDAADLDDIHFKMAMIYTNNDKKAESLVTHLEVAYLYPNSEHAGSARDHVRTLLIQEKKFQSLKDKIDELLNPVYADSSKETAHYRLIQKLYYYNFEPISEPLVASCVRFMKFFPDSRYTAEVNFWEAELLAKAGEEVRALAEYLKVAHLHRGSVFVSPSKLKVADLQASKLKMHEKAISTLKDFVQEFPDDPQAAFALLRTAQIIEKETKDYVGAIEAYAAVAKNYPQSLEAVPALFEAARLYESKFKEYSKAIEIYAMVVRDFKKDIKAPYALTESARIYESRLKDYANAAKVYRKVYELYPDSNIAAESLYAAGEINEKKIKNNDAALADYRTVVDKYPNTKIAENASKRIEKLAADGSK